MMNKLTKAKCALVLDEPFLSEVLLSRPIKEDNRVPVMATDGKSVIVNPKGCEEYTKDELIFIFAHEACHIFLLHILRMENYDNRLWNIASDYVVNLLLKKENIGKMPENALYNERFDGMSVEEVYEIVKEEQPPLQKPQSNPGDGVDDEGGGNSGEEDNSECPWGGMEDLPTDSDRDQLKQDIISDITNAIERAKQEGVGSVGDHILRALDPIIKPRVDWKVLLKSALTIPDFKDYDMMKRNWNCIDPDLYLPDIGGESYDKIVFAIDTSGSMDEAVLQEVYGEIQKGMNFVDNSLQVMSCDTSVKYSEELEYGDELEPVGGGGTAFRPVFEEIKEEHNDTKVCIYFTDGYCDDFGPTPDCQVYWLIYNNDSFEPPFGDVLYVEND